MLMYSLDRLLAVVLETDDSFSVVQGTAVRQAPVLSALTDRRIPAIQAPKSELDLARMRKCPPCATATWRAIRCLLTRGAILEPLDENHDGEQYHRTDQ